MNFPAARCERALLLGQLVVALLAICACRSGTPTEDPIVARRCSPVRALLSKNYHARGNAVLPLGLGAGMEYEAVGPIVSAEHANRITASDQLCRAWVAGAVSTSDYCSFILKVAVSSLPHDPSEPTSLTLDNLTRDLLTAFREAGVLAAESPHPEVLRESARSLWRMSDDEVGKLIQGALPKIAIEKEEDLLWSEDLYLRLAAKIDSLQARHDSAMADRPLNGKDAQGAEATTSEAHEHNERGEGIGVPHQGAKEATSKDNGRQAPCEPQHPGERGSPGSDLEGNQPRMGADAIAGRGDRVDGADNSLWHRYSVRHTVHFRVSKADIDAEEDRLLEIELGRFRGRPGHFFDVVGHADASGPNSFNEYLSLRRAAAVKDWLVDRLQLPGACVTVSGHLHGSTHLPGGASGNRVAVVFVSGPE